MQSRLSPSVANEARASYVRVRDNRAISGEYPNVTINNVGGGAVNLGIERSSMANRLDQDIYTLEDNLTWYKGNHTFTFGTHNELYKFTNLSFKISLVVTPLRTMTLSSTTIMTI